MRRLGLVAIGIALTSFGSPASASDGYRHGRLHFVEPGVSLQRAAESSSEEAVANLPFLPGDRIWTAAGGRVDIQFSDGSSVWVDRRSKLDYSGHETDGRERIVLRLWSGSLALLARDRRSAQFEIETPGGTLVVRDPAKVRIDVESGEVQVRVYEGDALLDDGRSRLTLGAGEGTWSGWGDGATDPQPLDRQDRDDFDDWVAWRESQRLRSASFGAGYLPEDLEVYGAELEDNGDWRYETTVGWVWVPRVEIDWAPYSNGHWSWTAYGWTWVPYERWGWAPFHYGRWDHSARYGWFWSPGRHWGPAWVSWAVGGGYVGWCPLGRHDRPAVAWGHHGRGGGASLGPSHGRRPGGQPGRGHAVPRGSADGPRGAWQMVRQGDLGRRASTRQRIPVEGIDAAALRVGESLRLRPTRDAGRLLEAEARPRAIRTRPTPGDSVRELAVDNRSVPSPGLRRGDPATRNGAPIAYDRRTRAGSRGEERPAPERGSTAPRAARPAPWFQPAEDASVPPARDESGRGGVRTQPRDDSTAGRRRATPFWQNRNEGRSEPVPAREAPEVRRREPRSDAHERPSSTGRRDDGGGTSGGSERRSPGSGSGMRRGGADRPTGGASRSSSGGGRAARPRNR